MEIERLAGILLHPTSLPSKYGIGDLGKEAYNFINFMEDSGQRLWQVFPLGPTGYGDSPYQCFSAFAGNPLLISPDLLIEDNLLNEKDVENIPEHNPNHIDYGAVINYKYSLLKKAYENFKNNGKTLDEECGEFCEANKEWLNDFALFMACKNYHGGKVWAEWDKEIAFRQGDAVAKWTEKLKDEVDYNKFLQFTFNKQWKAVEEYAHSKNIKIIGDIPIFIAYDSSDLWANRNLFTVNDEGKLDTVAGVPPDYFSATGQLWGNPLYKWDVMEKNNFEWWTQRFSKMFELVDIVRIDHFRGFEAYYSIPGDAETAEKGTWIKAPGEKLFNVIRDRLGQLPIIAEDLGIITKEVEELRDKFNFPGIKILQFAFGEDNETKFLPHNHPKNCVVHTGSHDNDTTRGFFEKEKQEGSGIFEWAQDYLHYYGDDICFATVKAAYRSVANIVIIPMQDMLNLGTEARMNFPGKLGGNWTWRFTWEQIPADLPQTYKRLTEIYERPPKPKKEIKLEDESKEENEE